MTTAPQNPQLPDALLPLIVHGCELLIEHTPPDGRLDLGPDVPKTRRPMDQLITLAIGYLTRSPDNPLAGDPRLLDLIERAGRVLVGQFAKPIHEGQSLYWYDADRPHEWTVESWLLSYRLLREAGLDDLVAPWADSLRGAAAVFDRYAQAVLPIRRMTSANLKISTNHFAYFAAMLIHAGQIFGRDDQVQRGLTVARKIVAHQHPDGYWPETHGPTTSYNQITVGAMGLCYAYTGQAIFREALERALDFHIRFSYPDASVVETIDQRVRAPGADNLFAMYAFSHWPRGRTWAETRLAKDRRETRDLTRLSYVYHYYQPGPLADEPLYPAGVARLSDQPAGLVRDAGWTASLSGIPSRPRSHRYTLDRQNLLSLWHERCGLILGGGGNRDSHETATFFSRIAVDPDAVVHGVAEEDAYVPLDATLDLSAGRASLDLEYAGFDAQLDVTIVDAKTCRVAASVATLPANTVTFNPNVLIDWGQPVLTEKGEPLPTGEASWRAGRDRIGRWFGQGNWRIELPDDVEFTLSYPLIPYRPAKTTAEQRLLWLSMPATGGRVELVVRIVD